MRQHGDYPVHKINAVSAFFCLPVQRRIFLHIVGHIRNMHAQTVSVRRRIIGHAHRVIQILGVLPVNGDHADIPQVSSARHVRLTDFCCNTLCLIQHLLRELRGKLIASDNGENVHSRVIDMPQNLHHFSFWILSRMTVLRDLCDHLMACDGSLGTLRRYKNITAEMHIIRPDKAKVFGTFKRSHQLAVSALQHAHHRSLRPLSRTFRKNRNLHRIPVHGTARHAGWHKEILFLSLYLHEAKPFCVGDKRPRQGLLLSAFFLQLIFHIYSFLRKKSTLIKECSHLSSIKKR